MQTDRLEAFSDGRRALAYYILQCAIIAQQEPESPPAAAIGRDWKEKFSSSG